MPRTAVAQFLKTADVASSSLEIATQISRKFKVSVRAAALRLIALGEADRSVYGQIPAVTDSKKPGGGGSPRHRAEIRVAEYGIRTAALFVKGLKRDVISHADAMNYLDVSYKNLDEIAAMV